MNDKRSWQDIMGEHSTKKDWINEANENPIIFCGKLCETIIKHEEEAKRLNSLLEIDIFEKEQKELQIEEMRVFLEKEGLVNEYLIKTK